MKVNNIIFLYFIFGRSVKLSQFCLLGHEIMQHSLNNEFVKDVTVYLLKRYKAGKTHIKKYYQTHHSIRSK